MDALRTPDPNTPRPGNKEIARNVYTHSIGNAIVLGGIFAAKDATV
jgi:hypothetical protein